MGPHLHKIRVILDTDRHLVCCVAALDFCDLHVNNRDTSLFDIRFLYVEFFRVTQRLRESDCAPDIIAKVLTLTARCSIITSLCSTSIPITTTIINQFACEIICYDIELCFRNLILLAVTRWILVTVNPGPSSGVVSVSGTVSSSVPFPPIPESPTSFPPTLS